MNDNLKIINWITVFIESSLNNAKSVLLLHNHHTCSKGDSISHLAFVVTSHSLNIPFKHSWNIFSNWNFNVLEIFELVRRENLLNDGKIENRIKLLVIWVSLKKVRNDWNHRCVLFNKALGISKVLNGLQNQVVVNI